ncbi:MAG: right-handed parallel beta-helix repeat-containing protein [Dehalococcoidia bacterium]
MTRTLHTTPGRLITLVVFALLATTTAMLLVSNIAQAAHEGLHVDSDPEVCSDTPVDDAPFCSIQAAVNAAEENDTIEIGAGTFALTSTLNLDKAVTIRGAGQGVTTIDARGVSGYGVLWTASNATVEDLTVLGPATGGSSRYGFKIQPTGGAFDNAISGNTIRNVSVSGSGGSEIDLNGVDDVLIENVTVNGADTSGVGIGIADSHGVTLDNVTTLGNNWGGVGIYTDGCCFEGRGTDNVTITGGTFSEPNEMYVEVKNAIEMGILSAPGFTHTVVNPDHRPAGETFTFYQTSEAGAVALGAGLPSATSSVANEVATGNFIVGAGMSIQTAIDAAAEGGTVEVGAGTFTENVVIDKSGLTLQGAGSGATTIDPAGGHAIAISGHVAGPFEDVTVSGLTLAPATGIGFIALSGTAVPAPATRDLTLSDIVVDGASNAIVLNAVEGVTMTDVHLSNIDSTAGALEMTGVSGLSMVDGTFSDNTIAVRLQDVNDIGLSPEDAAIQYGVNGSVSISAAFTGNTEAIVNGDSAVTILAENNWWGTADGAAGLTTGDVDADPWCTNPGCTTFSDDAAPPPVDEVEPDPTPEPTPASTPVVEPGDVAVEVENNVEVEVTEDAPAEAETQSSTGSTAKVAAPAGALPAGAKLTVGSITNQEELVTQAPPPPAAEVALAFVIQAQDSTGAALTEGFAEPIALEFNVPAASIPEGSSTEELVLVFWNGEEWIEVAGTVTVNADGSVTINASVDHFTIFAVMSQPGRGTFGPAPAATGVSVTMWRGGGMDRLTAALLGSDSVWVTVDGAFVGYVPGAPEMVNAAFLARFPNGLQAGTPVVVTR